MDIQLTDEEVRDVADFERTLGCVLALTNDYFSWRKEKHQSTDRMRNGVPILMRQYKLPESQARMLLKGIIVEEEEKAKRLRLKLESRPDLSPDFKRYLEALELYCGANCYWSATCPRYNKPQEEPTEAQEEPAEALEQPAEAQKQPAEVQEQPAEVQEKKGKVEAVLEALN
jgi:hypothetical protein